MTTLKYHVGTAYPNEGALNFPFYGLQYAEHFRT